MTARAILELAYQANVVPSHLYGKTQQKTLQARLSEDILHRRDASAFYRTEPGHFFLVELLNDTDIPEAWKTKFPARRRTRDLKRENALGIQTSFLKNWGTRRAHFHDFFSSAHMEGALAYLHPDEMATKGYCSTWTFSLVLRDNCVLAYRVGRYRDDRDAFANKRSVGFPGPLSVDDVSLFSQDGLGAAECATSVLVHDLDLSFATFDPTEAGPPSIDSVMVIESTETNFELVIVLTWDCPSWFEPTTKRLSLNDPHWLSTSRLYNNLCDLEPWSSRLMADWTLSDE